MSTLALHHAFSSLVQKGHLKPNVHQASLIDRLALLQEQLSSTPQNDRPSPRGLYCYGTVGVGKSRIADLFAATLPAGISKRRTHFHEFMLDIHQRLHHARSASGYAGDPCIKIGRDVAQESRLLCFDEFQVSDIVDAMLLSRLFGAIFAAGGVMVSTSNRHPDELYANGLNRELFVPFIKQLKHQCEVWKLEGDQDYRMNPHTERDDIFFTDQPNFDASLQLATDGSSPQQRVIPVMMNRVLEVQTNTSKQDVSRIVVRSTFQDLCKRELGTADYHALCAHSTAVYLSGLEQFQERELDFVRRFITLIDIAYEYKTKVVCLSSCPLTDLFGRLAPDVRHQVPSTLRVKKEGGSSSSMMSTFIGETEWSATGLADASLATGGAGETDVKFAIGRAVSRLTEMERRGYGTGRQ